MAKNNNKRYRPLLMTALFVAVALVGILLFSSDHGEANQTAAAAMAADHATPTTESVDTFSSGALPTLAKMVGALFLVIVCIYFGVYLLKKTVGAKYGCTNKFNALEVMETVGIGPKQSVTLVRVGNKSVLVGLTGERMAMLTELNSEETTALIAAAPDEAEPDAFSRMLKTAAVKMKKLTAKQQQTVLES